MDMVTTMVMTAVTEIEMCKNNKMEAHIFATIV